MILLLFIAPMEWHIGFVLRPYFMVDFLVSFLEVVALVIALILCDYYLCSVSLSRDGVGWSAVCDCGIS